MPGSGCRSPLPIPSLTVGDGIVAALGRSGSVNNYFHNLPKEGLTDYSATLLFLVIIHGKRDGMERFGSAFACQRLLCPVAAQQEVINY